MANVPVLVDFEVANVPVLVVFDRCVERSIEHVSLSACDFNSLQVIDRSRHADVCDSVDGRSGSDGLPSRAERQEIGIEIRLRRDEEVVVGDV